MLPLETILSTPWLLYLVVIFVSLCVGSFLNVVILRLPKMMKQEWRCQCEEFLEVRAPHLTTSRRSARPVLHEEVVVTLILLIERLQDLPIHRGVVVIEQIVVVRRLARL